MRIEEWELSLPSLACKETGPTNEPVMFSFSDQEFLQGGLKDMDDLSDIQDHHSRATVKDNNSPFQGYGPTLKRYWSVEEELANERTSTNESDKALFTSDRFHKAYMRNHNEDS